MNIKIHFGLFSNTVSVNAFFAIVAYSLAYIMFCVFFYIKNAIFFYLGFHFRISMSYPGHFKTFDLNASDFFEAVFHINSIICKFLFN